jgi:mRNA-degrading endonuclease toxin of MazEF toxin-antitoxin module
MERGDIWHVDLDPTKGHEQRGKRFVFIVSPAAFNRLGMPVVLPVTTVGKVARNTGFAVSLMGAGTTTTGVVQCDQPRTIDMRARNGKFVEAAPDFITDDVMAKLVTIFE